MRMFLSVFAIASRVFLTGTKSESTASCSHVNVPKLKNMLFVSMPRMNCRLSSLLSCIMDFLSLMAFLSMKSFITQKTTCGLEPIVLEILFTACGSRGNACASMIFKPGITPKCWMPFASKAIRIQRFRHVNLWLSIQI